MLGGDKEAFAELYRRRQRDVYRFALHMTGIPDVAEDVTQEVFMVLMRRGNEYDELKGSVNAFLLGVARNYVLRDLQELTYSEAALVLGCAIGTVRSRLHRARTMLIEKLRTRDDGAPEKELESARCFA